MTGFLKSRTGLFSLMVWAVFALPLQGQRLGETVKNLDLGITFRVPKDWVSIPVDPLDQLTVYKFQAGQRDRSIKDPQVSFTATMDLLFFPLESPDTAFSDGGERSGYLDRLQGPKYRNYAYYLKKKFNVYMEGDSSNGSSQKIPKTQYDFTFQAAGANDTGVELHLRAVVYHTPQGDLALQFRCLEDQFKTRHKKVMESCIRSLTFRPLVRKKPLDGVMESLNDNQRYIQEQIEKLPNGWYYFWSKKKHYVVFSDTERSFAKKIAGYLETMRAVLEKEFPGNAEVSWIPIVRICRTQGEYIGYGGMEGTAGYWWDLTREFVIYRDLVQGERRSFETLRHESFHHYIHFLLGVPPAIWFDEGFACYYEGSELAGNRLKVKPNLYRRDAVRQMIRQNHHIPLNELIAMDHRAFMDQPQRTYPMAWSLVYFLREGKRQGVRKDSAWENLIDCYVENLVEALKEMEDRYPNRKAAENEVNFSLSREIEALAREKTFGDWTESDWDQLEKAWVDFYD